VRFLARELVRTKFVAMTDPQISQLKPSALHSSQGQMSRELDLSIA